MHEAKTHLSRLVEKAAKGESFIIAKAGKPMVKVVPIEEPRQVQRLGFLSHVSMTIPNDFDTWGDEEIAEMFDINP
jgi:prevent-host-death family protein